MVGTEPSSLELLLQQPIPADDVPEMVGMELKIVTIGAEAGAGRKAALPTAANVENLFFVVVDVEVVFKFIAVATEEGREEEDAVLPPPADLNEGLVDDDPLILVTADDRIIEDEEAGLPTVDAREEWIADCGLVVPMLLQIEAW